MLRNSFELVFSSRLQQDASTKASPKRPQEKKEIPRAAYTLPGLFSIAWSTVPKPLSSCIFHVSKTGALIRRPKCLIQYKQVDSGLYSQQEELEGRASSKQVGQKKDGSIKVSRI